MHTSRFTKYLNTFMKNCICMFFRKELYNKKNENEVFNQNNTYAFIAD
jgi:hypothetical protein